MDLSHLSQITPYYESSVRFRYLGDPYDFERRRFQKMWYTSVEEMDEHQLFLQGLVDKILGKFNI